MYAVSLADDFLTLSTTIRFAVQFAAAGALLWAVVTATPAGTFNFLGSWLNSGSLPSDVFHVSRSS